ncbi:hypothetical protein [Nocardia transvalensis]|uniref:hypothetical protein n=1 Tax=Nocardia transvalensis TaxID=37333 RepID=UPI0018956107|nr:hypothetical protein [Nocardia transvalensis]MBF6329156.1 hypothetical protein [Nocardia transvalensis]
MRSGRALVEMTTGFLATLVAGLSLVLPINFAWTADSSVLQLDLLAYSLPRAIAAGSIVALVVAVFATTVNHALAAWGSALFGIAIMFVNHLAGRHTDPASSLSTLNFVDAIGAGILLGGIAVAVLYGRQQVFGWTLGALTSVVVGVALPMPHGAAHTPGSDAVSPPTSDSPPQWLIVVTMLAIAWGTIVDRHRAGVERRSVELPMAPILAGALYIAVALFGAEWLARHGDDAVDIGLVAAATVGAGFIAAMLLPRRDGTLVLLAVALSAVGSAIVPSSLPSWSAVPLAVVLALALLLGMRRPAPLAGLFALAVVAFGTALAGSGEHQPVRAAISAVLLSVLAGYCFGSATPRYNPTRVLGVAIVFVPSVVMSLRDHVSHRDHTTVAVEDGHWQICPAPAVTSSAPAWTALSIAVGCIIGLFLLRRWRAPTVAGPADQ